MALRGLKEHKARLKALPALAERNVAKALFAAGQLIENEADRAIHGSDSRGDKNKNSKLNDEKVLDIEQSTVWKILHRKAWAWL